MHLEKDPSNFVMSQSQPNNSEISIFDLVYFLLRRKKIILTVMIMAIGFGLIYAFSQKRIYQVDTILLKPAYENVESLSVHMGEPEILAVQVYNLFFEKLKSRKFKKRFFKDKKIINVLSGTSNHTFSEKEFNAYLDEFIAFIKIKGNRVFIQSTHGENIAEWLDELILLADKLTVEQLVKDLKSRINKEIRENQLSIQSKRSIYSKRKEDDIVRLQESYNIAKELGITDHLFVPNVDASFSKVVSAELNSISKSLSNENHLSEYMKGTKVLQAEINALKNRKLTDSYVLGIRDFQEKIDRLSKIKIDTTNVKSIIVDKKASVNISPIKPNRKLIVIVSAVIGFLLGVVLVFLLEFIKRYKLLIANNSDN